MDNSATTPENHTSIDTTITNAATAVKVLFSNSTSDKDEIENITKASVTVFNPEQSSCALWRLIQPTYPSLTPPTCRSSS